MGVIKGPRQTRYGHALRRLIQGKTTAISGAVARRLAADGLVEIPGPDTLYTVVVTLTEKGKKAAALAVKGVKLYEDHKLMYPL